MNAAVIQETDDGFDGPKVIREMANVALLKSKDWPSAAAYMRRKLDRDPALMRTLVDPLIDAAIWAQIRNAAHKSRVPYMSAQSVAIDTASDITAIGEARRLNWLQYQLNGGQRLGDATAEVLQNESRMHAAFARGNAIKAKLFEAIAQKIGANRVRDVLDHAAIVSILETISC